MIEELFFFVSSTLWLVKSYINSGNLPKLYYRLASRRNVTVKDCRELEKDASRVSKLTLDIAYFEKCIETIQASP